ncbi:MAG: glutathione S-transferase [Hydrotalea sp.]|nr:glutathione S-transferase [Hydrotalea sp.]
MAKEIIFHYAPQSRAETTLWALEELGAPYQMKSYSLPKKEHKKPDFLKINPFGKVPALVVDGVVITESAAILAYLGDEFAAKNLAPKVGDKERGSYFRWLFLLPSVMEPSMMDAHRKIDTAESASQSGWPPLADFVALLTATLENNDYIAGKNFTLADVAVASTLNWVMMWGMVQKTELFEKYIAKCFARDAKHRALKISQEILEKQK